MPRDFALVVVLSSILPSWAMLPLSVRSAYWTVRVAGALLFLGACLRGMQPGFLLLVAILIGCLIWVADRQCVEATLARIHRVLASSRPSVEKAAEARRRYDDLARTLGPSWAARPESRMALANVLRWEKRSGEAAEVLKTLPMHRFHPRRRMLWLVNLAEALLEAKNPSDALMYAKLALDCAPKGEAISSLPTIVLAESYLATNRAPDAIEPLQEALGKLAAAGQSKRSAEYRAIVSYLLGDALVAVGRRNDGVAAYKHAIAAAPEGGGAGMARKRLKTLDPYR
jgi:predicted negative regulator of RcsB-dependent stress response